MESFLSVNRGLQRESVIVQFRKGDGRFLKTTINFHKICLFIIMATLLEIAMQTQHTLISLQPQSPLLKIIIIKKKEAGDKIKKKEFKSSQVW